MPAEAWTARATSSDPETETEAAVAQSAAPQKHVPPHPRRHPPGNSRRAGEKIAGTQSNFPPGEPPREYVLWEDVLETLEGRVSIRRAKIRKRYMPHCIRLVSDHSDGELFQGGVRLRD